MRKSWLTAASALTAATAGASSASAAVLFAAPAVVHFGDTLVGSSLSETFDIVVLNSITSGHVSGASAPFSGGPVSLAGATKGEVPATYAFKPATRGGAKADIDVTAINLGLKIQQGATILFDGTGVAPVESISTSPAPVTRIGTSGVETVTIANVGDGNLSGVGEASDLLGKIGASQGVFDGPSGSFDLEDNAAANFSYTFTPTKHGAAESLVNAKLENGSADGANQATSVKVALGGRGVGPEYSSTFDSGVIDLGDVTLGSLTSVELTIDNLSEDDSGGLSKLTDLSLLKAQIKGVKGSTFSLDDFVPGTILGEGESRDLKIDFDASKLGQTTADLIVLTDQDAAFGHAGEIFTYRLTADVVPSPVPEARTWEMLLAGFSVIGLQYRRSRRRAVAAASRVPPQEK